ncbi:MAG: septum formation protein Maf [Bacteroidetes bacterium]|nr:septum formation protein Maf [Bacteroidota bacterium]
MLKDKLNKYNIILASKSPRRQFLLKELGLDFQIKTKDTDESFPKKLKGKQIALYLSKKKAHAFKDELKPNDLLITADTIVWIGNKVLNKPANYNEAVKMLQLLSGKTHTVYTGVCITSPLRPSPLGEGLGVRSFVVSTKVFFKKLTNKEIHFYITNYKPYDKAGAYGAQEWIGYVGVEKIIGSYFNVMGLPVKELYEELLKL